MNRRIWLAAGIVVGLPIIGMLVSFMGATYRLVELLGCCLYAAVAIVWFWIKIIRFVQGDKSQF